MTGFKNHWATKSIALSLAFCLLWGGQFIFPRETNLEGLFKWSVKNYLEGKYWEVSKDLELLLSFIDEHKDELPGKIYLLLGAAYEQLGDTGKAKQNYQLALEISETLSIEPIDLSLLPEYQRIFMKKKEPLQRKIIEKPAYRKRKRFPTMYILGGVVILAGLILAFKSRKKVEPEVIDVVPDYDTRVLGIEWMLVPAGEFLMGDNFNEGEDNEQPVHTVLLDEYYISKYELTFEQYDKYCDETGTTKPEDIGWGRGNRPVINVSWQSANSFCKWLSRKTGKNIRLPTEAQWEKAARGTGQRRYPWGNSPPDCTRANHECDNQTHPVGSHPAGVSPYGIQDMAGNVSEWCRDYYGSGYYNTSPYYNPLNEPPIRIYSTTRFIIRGGSWASNQSMGIRCADRGFSYNETRSETVGFRLVMER